MIDSRKKINMLVNVLTSKRGLQGRERSRKRAINARKMEKFWWVLGEMRMGLIFNGAL